MSKIFIGACVVLGMVCSCNPVPKKVQEVQPEESRKSYVPEMATVYRTAEGTEDRLTNLADVVFEDLDQPYERQPCIFLDPSHTFQTFIGIGGALTDASAEVFAQLPADKQEEFLAAYYDKEKGIGYSIARTILPAVISRARVMIMWLKMTPA